MRIIKKVFIGLFGFLIIVLLLFSCNVMWKSPANFKIDNYKELKVPIMNMESYKEIIAKHRRPYIYSITSSNANGGKVFIVGVEHINDPNHSQFDSIRKVWRESNPDVALVEGRLGFLFSWFQNPIKKFGEGGLTSSLAKKDGAKLYSWEPEREDEVKMLKKKYSAEQLAMFYSLRPIIGRKITDMEQALNKTIKSRTDYDGIRNVFKSWKDLDKLWKKDFPNIDWRTFNNGWWPKGYLSDIANDSNLARDNHMIQIISELVKEGKTVFVTMGVSHAPRIEQALQSEIQ